MNKYQDDSHIIQKYLDQLFISLGDEFSVEQKEEIVREIQSHILAAKEQKKDQNVHDVLINLGPPEELANRYKAENPHVAINGNKAVRTKLNFNFKVMAFCGLLIIIGLIVPLGFMTSKFKFLGTKNSAFFLGQEKLDQTQSKKLVLQFNNGKLFIKQGPEDEISWKCKGSRPADLSITKKETLFFWIMPQVSCILKIPRHMPLIIQGSSGRIFLNSLMNSIDLEIDEGKVKFSSHPDGKYKWDIIGHNSESNQFLNSADNDALLVRMNVKNGKIEQSVKLNEDALDE